MSVVTFGGTSEADAVRLAAALERSSEHPLAAAIVSAARDRGIEIPSAADFRSVSGKGIVARVDRRSRSRSATWR